ncbi:hypothetical protein EH165_04275 [Nakamurella antarctica]|uniref:non-specific serine/threonine protein kinase n=2 Tax=Nakamurella antarctica TaxID=1902245 RepID=A0A3G8ZYH2_9ACTN|nr:hypothetical protein EH165_04275 [Nakamurella antarctica]
MGSVYLALHPRLPRRDALKLLSSALSTDDSFRARFEREADLAARLIHRNIVAVYDRGSYEGQLWIAMQYVAGSDAAQVAALNDGSMTPARVVHIISETGAGLDFAHRNGLLHRDVKPANILLAPPDDAGDPETVLLTDFGIAKPLDETQQLTGGGNLLATLAYASPEQIEAKPVDRRSDIYALGCVLYELLTRSVPFPEQTPFATMTAHLKKPPPRPSEAIPGLPIGFDAVIAKALAKNPEDRYSTCRELTTAAKAALAGGSPGASAGDSHASREQAPIATAAPGLGAAPHALAAAGVAGGAKGYRPPFHITVRRVTSSTGPTAPGRVTELGPILTQNLPGADRDVIEGLINRARFFDLPPRLPLERLVNGDEFIEITVGSGQDYRSVGFEKLGSRHPAELDHLVAGLERILPWRAAGAGFDTGPSRWSLGTPPPPEAAPSTTSGLIKHAAATSGDDVGSSAASGRRGGRIKWLALGLVAVLVMAATVVTLVLISNKSATTAADIPATPSSAAQAIPATPSGLVSSENGRTVTMSWDLTKGASEYVVMRNGEQVYSGAANSFTEKNYVPGSYNFQVAAKNASGTSGFSDIVAVTVTAPWGALAYMVDEFSSLLPATPDDKGYAGMTCDISTTANSVGSDGFITCTDVDKVAIELVHFPSKKAKADFLATQKFALTEPWTRNDETAGTLYRSEDASKPAELWTDFLAGPRDSYLLVATWKDHTTRELIDSWWTPAVF